MGRGDRDREYSPVVERKRQRSRSRSRSQTYSPSPKREVISKKDERERRRSRSRSRSPRDRGHGSNSGSYSGARRYHDGRDNADPCPCLGVFGMSLHTSERDLKHLFGRYGEIESVQIVYDRYTGRSRGFGFVYFNSTKDATRAKKHMTDAVIDGMKVRVDYSVTKGGGPYQSRHIRKDSRSPLRHRSRTRSRSR